MTAARKTIVALEGGTLWQEAVTAVINLVPALGVPVGSHRFSVVDLCMQAEPLCIPGPSVPDRCVLEHTLCLHGGR